MQWRLSGIRTLSWALGTLAVFLLTQARSADAQQTQDDDGIATGYMAGSVAAAAFDAVTIPLNVSAGPLGSGRRWHGPVGLLAGGVGIALGAAHLGDNGAPKTLAIIDIGLGSVAAILGVVNLLSEPEDREILVEAREHLLLPVVTRLRDGRTGLGLMLKP